MTEWISKQQALLILPNISAEVVRSMPTMTDEELKAEARRRGYTLVPKPPKQIKLIPCKCGRKAGFERWYDGAFGGNKVSFRCPNCGAKSESARSERTARQNWNKMQGGQ